VSLCVCVPVWAGHLERLWPLAPEIGADEDALSPDMLVQIGVLPEFLHKAAPSAGASRSVGHAVTKAVANGVHAPVAAPATAPAVVPAAATASPKGAGAPAAAPTAPPAAAGVVHGTKAAPLASRSAPAPWAAKRTWPVRCSALHAIVTQTPPPPAAQSCASLRTCPRPVAPSSHG
jgi:hypothetical protein